MTTEHHVAIIGVAGRFPGACNVEQFWANLREGEESIAFPRDDELLAAGVAPEQLARPGYVRAVACAPDVEGFDAAFFGYTPREAAHSDPQIRMMLEAAHAALENAGVDPASVDGNVGVYASAGNNRYIDMHLRYAGDVSATSSFLLGSLNNTDYVASTISYKLNLHGPSITLSTACSSSLVAVHLAGQALRSGECDLAVAGGVDVELPLRHGYQWEEGGPVSRDGHVRPFDAAASGTLFGTGCAAVVLKRLADAVSDGDTVLAVIRGSAVNNDGADKVGFSAPSVNGQAMMIAEALSMAGVSAADISYVEAHATGTAIGDPIEVAALDKAFRAVSRAADLASGSCALSSVKGNVGHLGHAAGITSLTKAVLAIWHEQIPATANFAEVNPLLHLEQTAFQVTDRLLPWPRTASRSRLAGVSSFGVGGTNAHVVLQEGPVRTLRATDDRPRIVLWSAKSDGAELAYRGKLAAHLKWQGDRIFPAAAATLQEGRRAYPIRRAVVAASAGECAAALSDGQVIEGSSGRRDIVFAFPGQGAQQVGMAAGLYRADAAFTGAMDSVLELFRGHGLELAGPWMDGTADQINRTVLAQPLLFAVEYSLAQQLIATGMRPAAVIGHSIGELAAAVVAGVLTLADGVKLVLARSRAMAIAPGSGMVAVAASHAELAEIMPDGLTLAVVNAPDQTVLAGTDEAIAAAMPGFAERRIAATRLAASAAFHSPLMKTAAAAFAEAFDGTGLAPPQLPLYSAAAGRRITDDEAMQPAFWTEQVTKPVRFDRALDALLRDGRRLLVETGPGRALTAIARKHPAVRDGSSATVPVLPRSAGNPDADMRSALAAVARIWAEGADVSWRDVRQGDPLQRVPLPGYVYERQRHWVEAAYQQGSSNGQPDRPGAGPGATGIAPAAPRDETTGAEPAAPHNRATTWAAPEPPAAAAGSAAPTPFTILCWVEQRGPSWLPPSDGTCLALLPEDPETGMPLLLALQQAGFRPVIARPAAQYSESASEFRVRPASGDDLDRMLRSMAARGDAPQLLVHALTTAERPPVTAVSASAALGEGLFSVLALLQAGCRSTAPPPGLLVLTSRSVDITGAEPIDPANAALHGFARSVAREEPQLGCRLVDLTPQPDERELAAQVAMWQQGGVVALRGARRWERVAVPFAPASPPSTPPIRRQGTYLITGGLGGLGLATAKALAGTGLRPRLILLGRTGIPDNIADGSTERLRAQLRELESLGAQVHVIACDVTDRRALRRAVDICVAKYGPVSGVLHLAGVAGDGLARLRRADTAAAVLSPKVQGTLLLAEVLSGQLAPVDFFACFSSRAAIDGLAGSADYAAANAFQDAYVQVMRRAGLPALAINWPSWAQVGMAVEHGMRTWFAELGAATCALLDEHRIDGIPVLPGTGHLDLAVRAFRAITGHGGPVRLKDVVFHRLLAARDPRSVEIRLFPDGRFESRSRPAADPAAVPLLHATGTIARAGLRSRTADLQALRMLMPDLLTEDEEAGPRVFSLGPRWQNNPRSWTLPGGDRSQLLLELELAPEFAAEADEHALHPTLLDSATSAVRGPEDGPHLPFLYTELRVRENLPARLFAHVRRRPAGGGVLTADVDLIAPDGRLLVEVVGFSMRTIDRAGVVGAVAAAARGDAPDGSGEPGGSAAADAGIAPHDGGRLLLSLLGSRHPGQVAVEPGGRPAAVRDPAQATAPPQDAAAPAGKPPQPTGAKAPLPPGAEAQRPAPGPVPAANGRAPGADAALSVPPAAARLGAQAAAPANGSDAGRRALEARLHAVWADVIGVPELDVSSDFFDLGGTSLSGVGMMTRIRETFSVELPLAALFDYPTVTSMAGALWEQGAR
jgi:phthiocerol/phenolphthiocerol synthesis type-I polyketide synthase E